MNKKELAKALKPLIKECISEMLLEEGLLKSVVSQISEGMKAEQPLVVKEEKKFSVPSDERKKMRESREKMIQSIGSERFNGVNIFEGTTPSQPARSPQAQASNPLSGVEPGDKGVDISSFANPNWRKLV